MNMSSPKNDNPPLSDVEPQESDLRTPAPSPTEFLTSTEAAKRLGLSMATIQKLVDKNILQAWKTYGGHRRISLESVTNYLSQHNFSTTQRLPASHQLKLMVITESDVNAQRLEVHKSEWPLPEDTPIFESLTEGLLALVSEPFDLLVLQMDSPRKTQEKTLEVLQKFMGSRHTLAHTLVLTNNAEVRAPVSLGKQGKDNCRIQVLHQALTPEWLSAYLSGFSGQQHLN